MKKFVLMTLLATLCLPAFVQAQDQVPPPNPPPTKEMHEKHEAKPRKPSPERLAKHAEKMKERELKQGKRVNEFKERHAKLDENLQKRIDDGIKDGSLTADEAKEVQATFDAAKAKRAKAIEDNKLQRGEVGPVNADFKEVNKLLAQKRSNDEGVKVTRQPRGEKGAKAKGPRAPKGKKGNPPPPAEEVTK